MSPKIVDDNYCQIFIEVEGVKKQVWIYANADDQREKMRQAHYWCDGYACAMGKPLKKIGTEI